jgi:choline-glycine betaine transporter
MKRFTVLLAVVATLASNAGFAQQTGKAATAAKSSASDDFSWGIGLGVLAAVGIVVGLAASSAASSPSSFSH